MEDTSGSAAASPAGASLPGAPLRWVLLTAVAPVAWGTNYYVTHEFLPAGSPLYGAAIRALPAGLLLLAVARRLPRGSWWWKSLVLGVLNMGGFFTLVYVAAQLLPTSLASTVMATSPLVMMVIAWPLLAERPRLPHLAGAGVGLGGVCLMLLSGTASADPGGVLASAAAMLMSSLGYVLAKRWSSGVPVLASTAWQLVAGGVVLIPVAAAVEGAPPALDVPAALAFAYVAVVATALAFAAWFAGLRHLPAGTVGLVGLLNPVTGVLLGTLLAAEPLTAQQLLGLALALTGVLLGRPRAGKAAAATLTPSAPPRPRQPKPPPPPARTPPPPPRAHPTEPSPPRAPRGS
ncbi:DMT family transporter [Streptomyces sp. NPDC041068]|uniref:DMT family transporter n=1 Tax=Streptomyces sp. NPDC041068 TaxID=3155130 RepID=UPI00340B8BE2